VSRDRETLDISLRPGELLLVRGEGSFVIAGCAEAAFPLCIEAPDGELVQGIGAGDLVVVSAPEGGPQEPALMLLELVRTYHLPLMVLPSDHPGSRRLRYVVSAGPRILLACTIRRGTHPDQHLICSSEELGGMELRAVPGGVEIGNLPGSCRPEKVASPFGGRTGLDPGRA
jgi:hypothetical protein